MRCFLFVGILGFVFGQISSIVIQHYPLALQKSWRQQCEAFLQAAPAFPASSFAHILCKSVCVEYAHFSLWKFFLRIKSVFWGMLVSILFCANFYAFENTLQAWPNLILITGLILLAGMDAQYLLLPDSLTLSLLWMGLGCNVLGWYVPLGDAVMGAAIGYLSLRILNFMFYAVCKKNGLGLGDCKLFAVYGAWWGYVALPYILLWATVTGLFVVGIKIVLKLQQRHEPFSFGPFLVFAGLVMMFYRLQG